MDDDDDDDDKTKMILGKSDLVYLRQRWLIYFYRPYESSAPLMYLSSIIYPIIHSTLM